jgi:hypothetical protein
MNGGYYSLGDEGIVLEIGDRQCVTWCPVCGAPTPQCICLGEEVGPYA